MRHDAGRLMHQSARNRGNFGPTGGPRAQTMPDLVGPHRGDDLAAAVIVPRQPFQMTIEMALDLVLRLGDETETRPVAEEPGGSADGKGAGVPERVQTAGMGMKLRKPLLAPGQMVGFLIGSLEQQLAGLL